MLPTLQTSGEHSASLRRGRLRIPLRNKLTDDEILLQEPFFPRLEVFELLGLEILQVIEGSLQILGEHFAIEALEGQAARGVAAGEVLVRATLFIEIVSISRFLSFVLGSFPVYVRRWEDGRMWFDVGWG